MGSSSRGKSGCFISRLHGIILALIVVILIVGVALMVHFIPDDDCSTMFSDGDVWEQCQQISEATGDCICAIPEDPVAPEVPEEPRVEDGLRLTGALTPSHYNIELRPMIYDPDGGFLFWGKVEIYMTAHEAEDEVILHIHELVINEATIQLRLTDAGGAEVEWTSWHEDQDRQYFRLALVSPLEVDQQYYLTMEFAGFLEKPDLRGFYVTGYPDDQGVTSYIAATHMQRVNARRVFPCFDEPSFKATFEMNLWRLPDYMSMSNEQIVDETQIEFEGEQWIIDHYAPSPVMSCYLVAVVIGKFACDEVVSPPRNDNMPYDRDYNVTLRLCTQPNYIAAAEFALQISLPILENFEEYTNIAYNLGKLDQVALPEFAPGGMENWGLALYRETNLLVSDTYTTTQERQRVASIIAHEIDHMWFGNLVTCDWWSVTWLNEGMASYMETRGVTYALPEWNYELWPIRDMQDVMVVDGKFDSQPVHLSWVEHHDDTPLAFDTVTYNKGAAVLRMIEFFMTDETLRDGLRNYLVENAYQLVHNEDLYTPLEEAAIAAGSVRWDQEQTSLSGILETWIDQMNYPVIILSPGPTETEINIRQELFLYDDSQPPNEESPFGEFIWTVPLAHGELADLVVSSSDAEADVESTSPELDNVDNRFDIEWMYRTKEQTMQTLAPPSWELFNPFYQGFFRVQYHPDLWQIVLDKMNSNQFEEIPPENRAQIINDAFALAEAGRISETQALDSIVYLLTQEESHYLPWYTALRTRVPQLKRLLYNTPLWTDFKLFLRRIVTPMYDRVGWDATGDPDEFFSRLTRDVILREACALDYEPCLVEAKAQFDNFIDNNNIPFPDQRDIVYCYGVRESGLHAWNNMLKFYISIAITGLPNSQYYHNDLTSLRKGISCSVSQVESTINLAMSIESSSMLFNILEEPRNHLTVWETVAKNWNNTDYKIARISILHVLTDWYSSDYELQKFRTFVGLYRDEDTVYDLVEMLKKVESQNMWYHANKDELTIWLDNVLTSDLQWDVPL